MLCLHQLHQFWHSRHCNKLPGFRLKSLRPDQDQDEMECKYLHLDKWKIQLNKLVIFVVPFLQKVSYSLWFRSKNDAKEVFSIICISNVSYICITILSSFGPGLLFMAYPDHLFQSIWCTCRCCWEVGAMEVRFSKWFQTVQMVLWIYSYLYLWHTMWLHAEKVKVKVKLWKSLILLCTGLPSSEITKKKPKKKGSVSRFT